jgi:hypothetical protein
LLARKKFVCAVDEMLSTGDMSAENVAMKFSGLGRHWACMFACNDISSIKPIIAGVQRALSSSLYETRDEVSLAFRNAYKAEIRRKVESSVLPPGIDLDDFYMFGLQRLGPDTFNRIFAQIQNVQLEASFLVCGFSGDDQCVFTFTDPGRECDYDLIGFWAIGSGATNALGSLFNLKGAPLRFRSYEEVIWRVCEAKFYAESAQGVGKTTTVFWVGKDDKKIIYDLSPLHGIWEATANRPIPPGVEHTIQEAIKPEVPQVQPTVVLPAVIVPQITQSADTGDGIQDQSRLPSNSQTSEDQQ